jgi:hypothetical protein
MEGKAVVSAEQSSEEHSRTMEERSGVGGSFLGDIRSRDNVGPTHVGRRRLAATGAEHCPCGERDCPGQSKQKRAAERWAQPSKIYFQTPLKIANSKRKPFLALKIFKLCRRLNFIIWNNFLNWVNFKFSTEFMR